jgi:CRISPR system Cascade subunit CasE
MSTKYLSRVALKRNVPAAALRAVFTPANPSVRSAASHQLIWTLFADAPDRTRDFLWREHDAGVFYTLSDRPPADVHGLFDVAPAKPFAPELSVGDRLAFDLRVNATVARGGAPGVRGKPCDIVMDAIHQLPPGARAQARQEVLDRVAHEWMARQGLRAGFAVDQLAVLGYSAHGVDRGHKRTAATLGILELRGIVSVGKPDEFTSAVGAGFGRAKAFGCGLMLIRRA